MSGPRQFQIGDRVQVPAPRSAVFHKRPASVDRIEGTIVGYEPSAPARGQQTPEWMYHVKIGWDEPWIEVTQLELLRLNPREGLNELTD